MVHEIPQLLEGRGGWGGHTSLIFSRKVTYTPNFSKKYAGKAGKQGKEVAELPQF